MVPTISERRRRTGRTKENSKRERVRTAYSEIIQTGEKDKKK